MIKIGETIYNILSNDIDVTEIVGNKIYPLVADVGTTFPFIVYKKSSYVPEYTKDGISKKNAIVEITIASDNYKQGVDIADKVFKAITTADTKFRLENNTEDWLEDTFIQNLIFNIQK
jgi:hypothetical protein